MKILSLGADGKSSFAVMTKEGLHLSPSYGTLVDADNCVRFEHDVRMFLNHKKFRLDRIVCDAHPDYFSTRLAQALHREIPRSKLMRMQHHFAHIVACLYDNQITDRVIGVSFDGAGYGDDRALWGGEFFIVDRQQYKRMLHFDYVRQPGGDLAARQGWRMAVSYLHKIYGVDFVNIFPRFVERIGLRRVSSIRHVIEQDVCCPQTSSVGRLFDAVASMTGICDVSCFEAEAAIQLERAAAFGEKDSYGFSIDGETIDVSSMICSLVGDVNRGLDTSIISARFHNTLGEIVFSACSRIAATTGIGKVVVSGGSFQNRYLSDYLKQRFAPSSLRLITHNRYSCTDVNVAVGQAVFGAEQKERE